MRTPSDKEKQLLNPPNEKISAVKFLPTSSRNSDELLLAVASWDGSVRIYDYRRNIIILNKKFCKEGLPVLALVATSPSSVCFGGLDKNVYLLDNITSDLEGKGEELEAKVIGCHEGSVYNMGYSEEEQLLVSGGRDSTIRLWPFNQAKRKEDTICVGKVIICLSVRGNLIAAGLTNGEVGIWDVRDVSKPVKISIVKDSLNIQCIGIFPNKKKIVYGTVEGKASIESISGEEAREDFVFKPHIDKATGIAHPVNSVCFFDNTSRFLMGGSDGKARIWDPDVKKMIADFPKYSSEVAVLESSSCGKYAAIALSYLDDRVLEPGTRIPPPEIIIRDISHYLF